jgi:succinylglutamate desuccinylase
MKIITKDPINETKNKLCIVTGIHGNEAFLFEYLKDNLNELKLESIEIKLILANQLAAERSIRCIDQDLNRSFNSIEDNHETKLAKALLKTIEGNLILDLHTHTSEEQFSLVSKENKEKMKNFIQCLGFKHSIIIPNELTKKSSLIENFNNSISIEVGSHNSQESVNCAKEVINQAINYLNGEIKKKDVKFLLAKEFVYNNADKKLITDSAVENFVKICKDQYLNEKTAADESFIPVLVSRNVEPGRKILLKCTEENK